MGLRRKKRKDGAMSAAAEALISREQAEVGLVLVAAHHGGKVAGWHQDRPSRGVAAEGSRIAAIGPLSPMTLPSRAGTRCEDPPRPRRRDCGHCGRYGSRPPAG
jgi:hypothetical protein